MSEDIERLVGRAKVGAVYFCKEYGKRPSNARLARVMGVSRSQIGRWTKREVRPSSRNKYILDELAFFGRDIESTIRMKAQIVTRYLEGKGIKLNAGEKNGKAAS